MKIPNKKLIFIIPLTAFLLWLAGGVVFSFVCMLVKPSEPELKTVKTNIYADSELYCVLDKYAALENDLPQEAANSFAGESKLGFFSYFTAYINILNPNYSGLSTAEKLAEQLAPEADAFDIIAYAKYLSETYGEKLNGYYSNCALFKDGVYGLTAAAAYYFNKTPDMLSDSEISCLKKIASIASYRGKTPSELAELREFSNLAFNKEYLNSVYDGNGAFIAGLKQELVKILLDNGFTEEEAYAKIYDEGLEVYSTLNPDIQQTLDDILINAETPPYFQAAVTVCDYEGRILGVAGGIGAENLINRTRVYHSIGSSIKPLSVYLPAIESGMITYSTTVPDEPVFQNDTGGWPQNYDKIYEGNVTVAKALRVSKNTVAVWLLERLGEESALSRLRRSFNFIGLVKADSEPISVALGYLNTGITTEELAAAYQIFGNGGDYYKPRYFTRVTDKEGNIIYECGNESATVTDPDTAGIINRLLLSNIIMPDGLGNKAALDNAEVFGKTGTTDNAAGIVNNTVFAGGTPNYMGVVWVGYDNPDSETQKVLLPSAVEIWKRIMEKLPQDKPRFDISADLARLDFCRISGLLASDGCDGIEEGFYKQDNLPDVCGLCGKS